MGKRGSTSGLSTQPQPFNPLQPAPQPQPQPAAPEPEEEAVTPQPQAGGLVSATGIQNMDDATLNALVQQALAAPMVNDGRHDTVAQRIADALGITAGVPTSVPQEAFAADRAKSGANGLMYRTVNDQHDRNTGALVKTAQQIAHDLTTHTGSYGLNYGGGRAYGVGLYFAAQGSADSAGAAAYHSSGYGNPGQNPYTIEARFKPGARVATATTVSNAKAKAWAKSHVTALRSMGIHVNPDGSTTPRRSSSMSTADMRTTIALCMGYDAFREDSKHSTYHAIFNPGALEVSRGNKYGRARYGQLK